MIVSQTTIQLLKTLSNKGAVWQGQHIADVCISELKTLLSDDEWWKIKIAHSHYLTGEGSGEFYDVMRKLIDKYSGK